MLWLPFPGIAAEGPTGGCEVLFPERSSQGVARVSLILSMVFFHPGYDFPFPSRDGIVIMENLV